MKNIVELASQSFGIIMPEELVDHELFEHFVLEEDALLRVDSVHPDGTIVLSDASGQVLSYSANELKVVEEQLRPQWRKLTPTA